MKIKLFLTLFLSLCFTNGYCAASANDIPANDSSDASAHMVVQPDEMAGKVLGVLIVANKNEIRAAREALKKSSNASVKNFAKLMIKQHTENLKESWKISLDMKIRPVKGQDDMMLQQKGKQELAKLKELQGAAFDKQYMSDMVNGHANLLNLLTKVSTEVTNPAVKSHLGHTLKHVREHLAKAKAIQQTLVKG